MKLEFLWHGYIMSDFYDKDFNTISWVPLINNNEFSHKQIGFTSHGAYYKRES